MAEPKNGRPKDGRTRNWAFICYPDSAPDNWQQILDNMHIQWVESPLHDSDLNGDETEKKPHWHVLLMFDSLKSYEQVLEITKQLHATIPQICQSPKGLVRYMAHLDNPEKHQYSTSDIIGHGGVDILELLKPTAAARYYLIREMSKFVIDNGIMYFDQLHEYAMWNRFDDWFPLLCDNSAFIMNMFISKRYHRARDILDGYCLGERPALDEPEALEVKENETS